MRPRNHAIERSRLAKQAKPLGQFIVDQLHAKAPGPPRVPAPPTDGVRARAGNRPRREVSNSSREAPVLHNCLKWLHQRGIFAHRENTGTVWINGQPVSFGYPGAADITGILPNGKRLEVETKSATGKQSDKQRKYQQRIEENHGVYLLVRSVEELEEKWRELHLSDP